MNDKIEQYAALKFGDDKAAIAEFVEGFTKEAASLWQTALNQPTGAATRANKDRDADTVQHTIMKGIGSTIGQGVGGMVVTGAIASAGGLVNSVKGMALHSKFLQALERAYQSNRILREHPKEKVLQYAETIFKFAPHLSTDSNVLSSIVANAIQGEGVYPDTIKMITDIEAKYVDNISFNPKTYSK